MSNTTLINAIQADAKKETQKFRTGQEVEVHQIIKDGDKERIQKFRGLIISTRGATPLDTMITVRADMDGIGIEKIFPVNSPFIQKIDILRQFKVRRANIRYIRNLTGKAARLKEIKYFSLFWGFFIISKILSQDFKKYFHKNYKILQNLAAKSFQIFLSFSKNILKNKYIFCQFLLYQFCVLAINFEEKIK